MTAPDNQQWQSKSWIPESAGHVNIKHDVDDLGISPLDWPS